MVGHLVVVERLSKRICVLHILLRPRAHGVFVMSVLQEPSEYNVFAWQYLPVSETPFQRSYKVHMFESSFEHIIFHIKFNRTALYILV